MSKNVYKTVIIGCGNIAGGYESPASKNIFTHAHAICVHRKTTLKGVYDISYKKATQFAHKWNTLPFTNLEMMLEKTHPDFIYICTPTETHLEMLEIILDYKPKAVICEKPLGNNNQVAKKVVRRYKQKRIPLTVNYSRRFNTTIRKIKEDIDKQNYGSFINASSIYTKGILHNGPHVIDLLRYFFGEIKSYEILSANFDYKKTDPTVDAFLQFKDNKKIHLIAADESCYSIFEVDLLFSKARIRLEESGMYWVTQVARKDPLFAGYRDLGRRIKEPTDANHTLLNLIDNVIGHIEKGTELFCSADDALRTQEACIKLARGYL